MYGTVRPKNMQNHTTVVCTTCYIVIVKQLLLGIILGAVHVIKNHGYMYILILGRVLCIYRTTMVFIWFTFTQLQRVRANKSCGDTWKQRLEINNS